jgi:hypothetical protein
VERRVTGTIRSSHIGAGVELSLYRCEITLERRIVERDPSCSIGCHFGNLDGRPLGRLTPVLGNALNLSEPMPAIRPR